MRRWLQLVGGSSDGEFHETDDPIGAVTVQLKTPTTLSALGERIEDAVHAPAREVYTRRQMHFGATGVAKSTIIQIAALESMSDAEAWAKAVGYEEIET